MTTDNDDKIATQFAFEALREQRRSRRWNNFFKGLFFLYLLAIMVLSAPTLMSGGFFGADKITALVDLQGVISSDSEASADIIVTGLRAAFEHDKTAGVIIRINSPGGSPVQSGYINDEIYRLKEKYPDIPIYAVIQDIGASGGYYVAAAADKIYADKSSIVGSIGVRMDGFGFVESMGKLGIERRLLTAGEHKGFLDPFLPLKSDDVVHIRGVLDEIHQQFIHTVLKGRRDRIVESAELFSGYVWTGERSLELGLVDALGSASYVAREVIGAEDIVDFTPRLNPLEQFARRLGATISEKLMGGFATIH
ncbi:MAG: S49 family peptidase [Proteobacteria bacterium]|nr:MAG: S49 family peptidase [Pseudomonadota bacterium]